MTTAAFLRNQGIGVEIAFSAGFKNGLKFANRIGAAWAILANGDMLALKNLEDGGQSDVNADELARRFSK